MEKMKGSIMDNWNLKLTSESKDHFMAGMAMAFSQAPGNKAEYYSIINDRALAFLWGKPDGEEARCWRLREPTYHMLERTLEWDKMGIPKGVTRLAGYYGEKLVVDAPILKVPYKMDATTAADFGWNWLRSGAEYPPKTEGGDLWEVAGFTLETSYGGHIWGHRYGIIGIRPEWALIGK